MIIPFLFPYNPSTSTLVYTNFSQYAILLYKFLTTNKSYGPRGIDVSQDKIMAGDIAQLSFLGDKFEHSLFIINVGNSNDLNTFSVAAHTYNVLGKKIGEYNFFKIRFVHIEDVGI